jgi:hypothetical protein
MSQPVTSDTHPWNRLASRVVRRSTLGLLKSAKSTIRIKNAAKIAFYSFILERFGLFPKRYHKRVKKACFMKVRYCPTKLRKPKITKFSAYKFYQLFTARLQKTKYDFLRRMTSVNRKRIFSEAYLRKLARMAQKHVNFNKIKAFGIWT